MDQLKKASHRGQAPQAAVLTLNRCGIPSLLLASATYQVDPIPIVLEGVLPFHRALFENLEHESSAERRAACFVDYMTVHFRLECLEDVGGEPDSMNKKRVNVNYLRLIRGWGFNSSAMEGAVLKYWVQSRFGLLPRYHAGSLGPFDSESWAGFMRQASTLLFATNAVEAQLDLLYTYCQYEMRRRFPSELHVELYRGISRMDDYDVLDDLGNGKCRVLMNNLSSFTSNRERAQEFGDEILVARVPSSKIAYFSGLLPRLLQGEEEYLVIGGVYDLVVAQL